MKTTQKLIAGQFRGWRAPEVLWLAFCLASIVALSVHWGEKTVGMTAAVTGMMYTVLAGKGKCACFVFGLVNAPLYAYIAFKAGYYGDFALNVYYFIMMFPAMYAWLRHQSDDAEESTKRTRLTPEGRLKLGAACLICTLTLWAILRFVGGSRPLCDSVTNALSIAAMFLTVRRAIEEWILWIIVDAVEVFMWWRSWCAGDGSIAVLLMWLLFLANGIYLFSLWLRIARKTGDGAEFRGVTDCASSPEPSQDSLRDLPSCPSRTRS